MVRSGDAHDCADCGGALEGASVCGGCGARAHAIELTVLPGGDEAGPAPAPAEVRLVRQLKMPAIQPLALAPAEAARHLPEAVKSMEEALSDGDLATADQILDEAMGSLLVGPGHAREGMRWAFLPVVLWTWCGILLLLLILSLVFSGAVAVAD